MRRRLLALAGTFYVFAGLNHFINSRFYLKIMPPWLPAHDLMNTASGVAEIAGGLALMHPNQKVRKYGGAFETATMLAVYPANIDMLFREKHRQQTPGGVPALLGRLPIQGLFIAWALAAGRRD
jgi:uncharacterized membrane protein